MKKIGGARTIKKKSKTMKMMKKRRKHTVRLPVRRKLENINDRIKRNLEVFLENSNNDNKFSEVLQQFEKFFHTVLMTEKELINSNNRNELDNFDIAKSIVAEKLLTIERSKGSIVQRIRREAPDVYREMNEYITLNSQSMNMNENTEENIIEKYYDILHTISLMEDDDDLSPSLQSNISVVQLMLGIDLIEEFMPQKKVGNKIEAVQNSNLTEMMNSFRGTTL